MWDLVSSSVGLRTGGLYKRRARIDILESLDKENVEEFFTDCLVLHTKAKVSFKTSTNR